MEFRRGVTLDLHGSVWGASPLLQLIYIKFVATPPPPPSWFSEEWFVLPPCVINIQNLTISSHALSFLMKS